MDVAGTLRTDRHVRLSADSPISGRATVQVARMARSPASIGMVPHPATAGISAADALAFLAGLR
jgi:hypothetical protein